MGKIEIEYYDEISDNFVELLKANLPQENYRVKPLIGEVSSGLRTLIANGFTVTDELKRYSNDIHKLHLDISILVENIETGLFELLILEVKKVPNLGLNELSQLIGYCLVSKSKFGILLNINNRISSEFSIILDSDKDLTRIKREANGLSLEHLFGVMVWNETTQKFEYTRSGSLETIPHLAALLREELS